MAFYPRLTENTPTPMQGNHWYYSDNWFSNNGYGPPYVSGNCTWYAFGRYNEIAERVCDLPLSNAGKWWTDPKSSAFRKGSIPALGAIACWATTDSSLSNTAPGHVAIVEQINSDGSIVISESGWNAWYFNTETLTKESGYVSSWMSASYRKYKLQGFIYADNTSMSWNAKSNLDYGDVGYAKESQEAYENACIIWSTLYSYGWTLNAVCALLGNIDAESSYNPWNWQAPVPTHDDSSTINNPNVGYGLVQWTPPSTYIGESVAMESPFYAPHFSDVPGYPDDGYAQLYAINFQTGHWYPVSGYEMTFDEFKASTADPVYLMDAFLRNYERPDLTNPPSDPGLINRRTQATQYWWGVLQGVSPSPGPTPPTPPTPPIAKRKMPLWFYLRRYF